MATTKKATSSTRTKKTASTRKKAAPKTSATSTRVTRVSASAKEVPSRNVATATGNTTAWKLDSNVLNIVIAEIVGTFILTMVALLSFQNMMPLYVGLALAVLVLSIGAASGSHVNPAVTFGLWAAGKLKTLLVPFYWAAQLLGAMAAVAVLMAISNDAYTLNFGHFAKFDWSVFTIELVGTAVFMFGVMAVISRVDLTASAKAVGVGLSLMAGLLVAGSLYTPAYQAALDQYSEDRTSASEENAPEIPHMAYVKGATLNPAVALAATESTNTELGAPTEVEEEPRYSRLGWEVILSTLAGAAIGANLARLMNFRFRF